MLRTSCKLTYTFKIKKNLWVQPLATRSTMTKSNIKNDLLQFPKHEVPILKVINGSKLDELTKFISASHAATLISMRTSNGPYKSLNDVLLKTKIDANSLNNFCISVINYQMRNKWKKSIKPNINTTQMPESILGIHVGFTAISWILVDSDFKVLLWESIIWRSNFSTYDVVNSVPLFVQQLPLSSSYVMEELKTNGKSCSTSFIMQHQIASCIGGCIKLLINQRTNNLNSLASTLYTLKSSTTARFFNLLVANETIAADYIMRKIVDDTKMDNEWLWGIHIPYELKQKYKGKVTFEREQMGQSLLKTLACLHIIKSCMC